MCKIDIADGFYRMGLLPVGIPKLDVVLPTKSGEYPLSGFPLALPMGWVNSPPNVCAATEKICDLANASIKSRSIFKEHPLDEVSGTPAPLNSSCRCHASHHSDSVTFQKLTTYWWRTNQHAQLPHMRWMWTILYPWRKGTPRGGARSSNPS
jgi:hypothetical protein